MWWKSGKIKVTAMLKKRYCAECGISISNRIKNAIYCKRCAKEKTSEYKRRYGWVYRHTLKSGGKNKKNKILNSEFK